MDTKLAEQSVLGCMLLFPDRTECVFHRLSPKMFSEEPYQLIFNAAMKLHKLGQAWDTVTVESRLGEEYRPLLVACCEIAPSVSRFGDYIGIVLEGWRVREMVDAAAEIQLGGTAEELLAKYQKVVNRQLAVLSAQKESGTKDFSEAAIEFLTELQKPDTSIRTGWSEFDKIVGGLQRKSVIVIAARPGKGKTDFALQMACQIALKEQVNYNSMEMPTSQLLERVVSRGAKINSIKLRDHDLTPEEESEMATILDLQSRTLHINFDETPSVSAEVVEGKIARYHPAVIFIDHLGLMQTAQKKNQWEAVAETTHQLKALALKHNVCIVELVQLNRQTDSRRATQGDLYGGSSVEQDADVVIALSVAEFEGFLSGEESTEVTASVLKNRHGGVGELKFSWQPQYHSYKTIETRYGE